VVEPRRLSRTIALRNDRVSLADHADVFFMVELRMKERRVDDGSKYSVNSVSYIPHCSFSSAGAGTSSITFND
jgi:hypothetical protein